MGSMFIALFFTLFYMTLHLHYVTHTTHLHNIYITGRFFAFALALNESIAQEFFSPLACFFNVNVEGFLHSRAILSPLRDF